MKRERQIARICSVFTLLVISLLCFRAGTQTQSRNVLLEDIPTFNGQPYIEINNNRPFFSHADLTTRAFEKYSELDYLGRCGVAFANICKEIMPAEPRGQIGMIKPTGWHTVRYNGIIDGNYLYNRCHLIGYALSGENANKQNLITGTRYMNIEGMLPFENLVSEYVSKTGNHVLYRSTPCFEGEDLIAHGVLLEAYSVEDNGIGICFNVFCFNVQPGIYIDYATGESKLDSSTAGLTENKKSTEGTEATSSSFDVSNGNSFQPETGDVETNVTFILNKNTMKFHYPYCDSVSQIKDKNKILFYGSRDEAIELGYAPCGACKP